MQKTYCVKCKKEVAEDVELCECEGRSFIFGEKFHFKGNGIVCGCGCDQFKGDTFADYPDKAVNTYKCAACGNTIGTESYRDKEDKGYWG